MRCSNVDGSYNCECFDGFKRKENDTLCIGEKTFLILLKSHNISVSKWRMYKQHKV